MNVVVAFQLERTGNVTRLIDGDVIEFPATPFGATTSATILIVNNAQATDTLVAASVNGSGFAIRNRPLLPLPLPTGRQVAFQVDFSPVRTLSNSGRLSLVAGGRGYQIELRGAVAGFEYSLTSDGATVPVSSGDALTFPPTALGARGSVTLHVRNPLHQSQQIGQIELVGNDFALETPLITPVVVRPGATLSLPLAFTPQARGDRLGQIRVQDATFDLRGTGLGAALEYSFRAGTVEAPARPGDTLLFGSVEAGSVIAGRLSIVNGGSSAATVRTARLGSDGSAFRILGAPGLPRELHPGDSLELLFEFAPTAPGVSTDVLILNESIQFPLVGTGGGPSLLYTFSLGDSSGRVRPSDTLLFGTVDVGATIVGRFAIENAGAEPVKLLALRLETGDSAFRLVDRAGLPIEIQPGQAHALLIEFAPLAEGGASNALVINESLRFPIVGVGDRSTLSELPPYSFTGGAGAARPLEQPAIGLRLESPFPVGVRGVLELQVTPLAFTDDPSIQFVTGGRSVGFVIEPGDRDARFASGSSQIAFQTGAVAARISIRPRFQTLNGDEAIPAAKSPDLEFIIPKLPPTLTSVEVVSSSDNQLTLRIVGLSTERIVEQIRIALEPAPGTRIQQPEIVADVGSAFRVWYGSVESTTLGSLFAAQLTLTLRVTGSASPISRLRSVTVTASGPAGSSNSVATTLP